MAIYKSSHKGSQIDNAVSAVLFSKGKGNNGNPIYFDQYTRAQLATIDSVPMAGSERLISSGAAAIALGNVVGNDEIQTATTLGDSGLPASQRAIKVYTDNQVATKQPKLIESQNISISESGEIAVTEAVIKNGDTRVSEKFEYFGGITEGNNAEVIKEIEKAKHSTFDRSKFTIVGSPNITDDGIASGFSTSNYLTKSFSTPIDLRTQYLEIKQDVIYNGYAKPLYTNSDYWRIRWEVETTGVAIRYSDYTVVNANYTRSLNIGERLTIITTLHSGDNTLEVYDSNSNKVAEASSTYSADSSEFYSISSLAIGTCFNGSAYENVILDLKKFSVSVDGVEVFSGNKTGIDTIKPDNYTVVGAPTISMNGIASGFSDGNYLKTNKAIPIDKDFVLGCEYTITQDFLTQYALTQQYLIGGTYNPDNDVVPVLFEHANSTYKFIRFNLTVDNNGTNQSLMLNSAQFDVVIGDKIKAVLSRKNGIYKAQYYKNGTQIGSDVTSNNTNNLVFESDLIIGQYKTNWVNQPFKGSIDLNTFKIYVDGNLVYQPCLKIPYTSTSNGRKIVDSNYEDRIVDMYNQFGYSSYFVQKTSSYLPATNEQEDIIYSYENGSTAYTQRANLHLEQRGTCIIGTAVTFPKAFADTNYTLSIPYSVKTKTGFTPDITGDYVAEGLITLGN